MKKLFITLILVFFGYQAQAQVLISLLLGDKLNSEDLEFGLDGGFNWSSLNGLEGSSSLRTFNLGFYFDIRMKNQWFLNTGVLVKSRVGADQLTDSNLLLLGLEPVGPAGEVRQVINYFYVPALVKYKFKNHIYTAFGPQIGLRNKAWVEFNSDQNGIESRIRVDNKDDFSTLDFGLTASTGYQLQQGEGMSIGVKYYLGLADIYKPAPDLKNSSFFLNVTIPIGKGKIENGKE
ncbi:outer membrane beta-barrel protein [Algoriphagus namhaensis]